METALRYELIKAIPDLENQIYPTNAPEGVLKPYLVYARVSTRNIKTLEGFTNKQVLSYMFNVMAVRYSQMITLRNEVENLLRGMLMATIGDKGNFYIEDIDINNITEQYEHELKVNRGIIDFTIYFEKLESGEIENEKDGEG